MDEENFGRRYYEGHGKPNRAGVKYLPDAAHHTTGLLRGAQDRAQLAPGLCLQLRAGGGGSKLSEGPVLLEHAFLKANMLLTERQSSRTIAA